MPVSTIILKTTVALFLSSLLSTMPASAATDLEAQESFARMRAKKPANGAEHNGHESHVDESQKFHGIFYGFLPCNNCNGIKATLSLKQNKNYLLVTQPAQESTREFYEKGKYQWDDKRRTLVLTPKKSGQAVRHYYIENEGTLIQLNDDGSRMTGDSDRYVLRSSDTMKTREVHIH